MNVVAFIPARAGSRRIPGKNLQVVGGKTLVQRAIDCAKHTRVTSVVVSSDDPEVLAIAKRSGVWGLVRTPRTEADDGVLWEVIALLRHELWARSDIVCILEPTAPFRQPEDIHNTLALMLANPEASGARTVHRVTVPRHAHRITRHGYMDPLCPEAYRGEDATYFQDNGIANVIRVDRFRESGRLFDDRILAWEIAEVARCIDIDEPEDLALARIYAHDLDIV